MAINSGATIGLILATILGGTTIFCYLARKFCVWRKETKSGRRASRTGSISSIENAWPPIRPVWPADSGRALANVKFLENGMLDLTKAYIPEPDTPLVHWNIARTFLVYDETHEAIRKSMCGSLHGIEEDGSIGPQVPPKVLFLDQPHRENIGKSRQRSFDTYDADSDSGTSLTWSQHHDLGRSDSQIKSIKRARTVMKLEGNDPDVLDAGESHARTIATKSSAHRLSAIFVQPHYKKMQRNAAGANMRDHLMEPGQHLDDKRSSFLEAVLDAGHTEEEFTFRV